jgi:hypothetical protein
VRKQISAVEILVRKMEATKIKQSFKNSSPRLPEKVLDELVTIYNAYIAKGVSKRQARSYAIGRTFPKTQYTYKMKCAVGKFRPFLK